MRDAVSWMGVMQAQDAAMAQWAIGVRLAHVTAPDVQGAINCAEIVRTHLLRPTWHVVAAEDVRWILALTAPHIGASLNAAHRAMAITPRAVSRTNALLEGALAGGQHLTREEVIAIFRRARIPLGGNRVAHILLRAELDGVICSGPAKEGKHTYALLDERVGEGKRLSHEQSLRELARRYFTSRAPATLEDFIWWSGLPAAAARRALELADLKSETPIHTTRTYWTPRRSAHLSPDLHSVHVLPAFDEYLISYRDRSAVLPTGRYANVVSSNGIFRPIILVGGRTAGLWKRTKRNDVLRFEVRLFDKSTAPARAFIEKAFTRYARFTGKQALLTFKGERRTGTLIDFSSAAS